jgi:hypothetical protein
MPMSLLEEKVSKFIMQDLDPADLKDGSSKSSLDSASTIITRNHSQTSLNKEGGNHGCLPIQKKINKVNLWQYLIE